MHGKSAFWIPLVRWAQMDPLPSSSLTLPISPSLPFPSTPLLSPHYSITIYILHQPLSPSKCPYSYCIPALPLTPHFRFFGTILCHPPATNTFPHHYISISIVSQGFLPLPDPSYPPAPACPLPPFSLFFKWFMVAFLHVFLFYSIYTYTYMIYCIEYQVFDHFFWGATSCQGRGKVYPFGVVTRP